MSVRVSACVCIVSLMMVHLTACKKLEEGSLSESLLLALGLAGSSDIPVFAADAGENGRELWITDGTEEGTVMLKDIRVGADGSYPEELTPFKGKVYFTARDSADNKELWVTDGTPGGTNKVLEINPDTEASSSIEGLTVMGDRLYFAANDGTNGAELWTSDGTETGTRMVENINETVHSWPEGFVVMNNKLYFSATDGTNGYELWVSDGTAGGTKMIADINPNPGGHGYPCYITVLGNRLVFQATNGADGEELWVSDGVPESEGGVTGMIEINNELTGDSSPEGLFPFNNRIFFMADNGLVGSELWSTDGTPGGTAMLKDIYPVGTTSGFPRYFTEMGGNLYFAAMDNVNGDELWVTDGTPDGTTIVRDIYVGPIDSSPQDLIVMKGRLYFMARDDETGDSNYELWTSDGTEDGTFMVRNIHEDEGWGSYPAALTVFNGTLYFQADDGVNGVELWATDGTEAGTRMVKDINPSGDSYPFIE